MARQKTKRINAAQYAEWAGCTRQNITKHIANGTPLQHVIKITKYSRFYLLEVPESLNAESFETPNNILS